MKYSRDEIDRLKDSTNALDYSNHLGLELQKVGHRFRACCPFHEDKTPSFYVNPDTNSFYCFGCQKHGDLITLARELKQLSFNEAVEDIRKYSLNPNTVKLSARTQPRHRDLSSMQRSALDDLVGHYQSNLQKNDTAKDYLKKRGLSGKVVDDFQMGFCGSRPASLQSDCRSQLQDIGLLDKYYREAFRGRITIPIRNEAGKIAQLYGRSIQNGSFNHRYLSIPHSTPFNPVALKHPEIYLCESIIDTLTLHCNGFENACGIYGTHSLKESYLREFVSNGVTHVTIAYDNDSAGNEAAESTRQRLTTHGISSSRMRLPIGLDVNAYCLQNMEPLPNYRMLKGTN